MRLAAVSLMVGFALGGCATAPTPERWLLDEGGGGAPARLVFGLPNSDDLRLLMTCQPHAGAVDVTVVGRRGDGAVIELHSDTVWNRYLGAGHIDEEGLGALDIDLKLAERDPVLRRFADKGAMTLVFTDGRREPLPNGFAEAHDFMAICRLPG